MTQSVEQVVVTLIARHKGIDPAAVSLGADLAGLGINSLDAITIAYDLEEDIGVEIPNEDIESLRTVQDLIDGLRRLTGRTD